MKNRTIFPAAPLCLRTATGGTTAHGETIPPCGKSRPARHEPYGVSRPSAKRRPVPPGPAPHAASRSTRSGTSRATAFRTHCIASRSPGRALCGQTPCDTVSPRNGAFCLRASSGPRPLPCPARTYAEQAAAQSMLREGTAFWQQEKEEKRHKKREPVQWTDSPRIRPDGGSRQVRTASSDGEAGAYGSSSLWHGQGRKLCRTRPGHPREIRPGWRSGPLPCSRRSSA